MPAMSDDRLVEVRSLNRMRKSIDDALIESLPESPNKESFRCLAAGATIDELLAEVERLRGELNRMTGLALLKSRLSCGFGMREAAELRGMKASEQSAQERGAVKAEFFDYRSLREDQGWGGYHYPGDLERIEQLEAENTKLRAIKNQLQQELAMRPER